MNSGKIVLLPGVAAPEEFRTDKTKAEDVLADAYGHDLTDVVVIGWDRQGNIYFDSSYPDGPNVLWLLENVKAMLLAVRAEDAPFT